MESFGPIRAVAWAQWRTSRNFYLRAGKGGVIFKWIMNLLWYAAWTVAGMGAAFLTSGRVPLSLLERAMPAALFLVGFFWQLFPIVLASQGAFIDLRRLLIYPIPDRQLFLLETVLRVTTAFEMIIVSAGFALGLAINRQVPFWGPLFIILYMVLNLLLATGIKSLLERLFKIRGVRELLMIVFVGLILLPQLLALRLQENTGLDIAAPVSGALRVMPWTAAASLAVGRFDGLSLAALTGAVALAYVFARLQFARSLMLEEGSGSPASRTAPQESTILARFSRWPAAFLLDPVAAIVEKDIRTLVRSPRFRLIFMMSSTFGAVLWLPQVLRSPNGWLANNYVTMAALYAMLVLGEVLYWNVFGFERAGAQHWFVTPVSFRSVLRAKNFVAGFFTFLSLSVISLISAFLPVAHGVARLADAFAAASVFLIFVLAGGNLASVLLPRPIDSAQAWRNSGGRTQLLLLLAYPVLTLPIALAHLARWATGSYWSYHGVLAICLIVGLCFYYAATEAAEEFADSRKERIVATLSRQDGPVSIST